VLLVLPIGLVNGYQLGHLNQATRLMPCSSSPVVNADLIFHFSPKKNVFRLAIWILVIYFHGFQPSWVSTCVVVGRHDNRALTRAE
jgi:hypothetical protein